MNKNEFLAFPFCEVLMVIGRTAPEPFNAEIAMGNLGQTSIAQSVYCLKLFSEGENHNLFFDLKKKKENPQFRIAPKNIPRRKQHHRKKRRSSRK